MHRISQLLVLVVGLSSACSSDGPSGNCVSLVAGAYGTMTATLSDGSAVYWGSPLAGSALLVPTVVPGLSNAAELRPGGGMWCARLRDGTVVCQGTNNYGELGNGQTSTGGEFGHWVNVMGLSDAIAFSAGDRHSCAVKADHTLVCWGKNEYGQLGDGTQQSRSVPTPVMGLTDVQSVSAEENNTCALTGTGVFCWGANAHGELGDGSLTMQLAPVMVMGLPSAAKSVGAAGRSDYDYACALLGDGSVSCWGSNNSQQLGTGVPGDAHMPTPMQGVTGAKAVATMDSRACVITADQGVACAGAGPLGDAGMIASSATVVAVDGLTHVASLAGNSYDTCALAVDGTVSCWGDSAVGNGTSGAVPLPVAIDVCPR
jgi:alpha-tubulin suppressor-like RCC1 family protein